jgi:hypothetical protein
MTVLNLSVHFSLWDWVRQANLFVANLTTAKQIKCNMIKGPFMHRNRICVTHYLSLGILSAITGCSSIPTNTPILLDRTTDRIETRSEVVTKAFRTTLDEAAFVRGDVEAARKALETITTTTLSAADKKTIDTAIKQLTSVETSLGKFKSFERVPDDSKRIFTESAATLKLIRRIMSSDMDKNALIQELINLIEKTKGDDK